MLRTARLYLGFVNSSNGQFYMKTSFTSLRSAQRLRMILQVDDCVAHHQMLPRWRVKQINRLEIVDLFPDLHDVQRADERRRSAQHGGVRSLGLLERIGGLLFSARCIASSTNVVSCSSDTNISIRPSRFMNARSNSVGAERLDTTKAQTIPPKTKR